MTFDTELTRVVDVLRSMPLPKLSRAVEHGGDGPTRAQRARDVAQWLADAAAHLEGQPRRVIPDVGDPAVGDQIAVTGADLARAVRGVAASDDDVLGEAAQRLRSLRLAL